MQIKFGDTATPEIRASASTLDNNQATLISMYVIFRSGVTPRPLCDYDYVCIKMVMVIGRQQEESQQKPRRIAGKNEEGGLELYGG